MAGKGDKRRPSAVSRETYDDNYDLIFRSMNYEQEKCEDSRPVDTEPTDTSDPEVEDSGDSGSSGGLGSQGDTSGSPEGN